MNLKKDAADYGADGMASHPDTTFYLILCFKNLRRKKGAAMNWGKPPREIRCQEQLDQVIDGLRRKQVNPNEIGIQNVQLRKWSNGAGITFRKFAELAEHAGLKIVLRKATNKK